MLTYARRAPLQPKKIQLTEVISGMGNLISRTIPANIHFETIFETDHGWINADVAGTESALLNLVLNARDAMPDGGKLTIAIKNIEIPNGSREQGLPEGRYVALSVTDTGTGIPQDAIGRVFDPFYSTKSDTQNSGLGLSMVDGFLTQSGGTVHINTEDGIGTTVELFFPASDSAQALPSESPLPDENHTNQAYILIAEDQPDVLKVLQKTLEAVGYTVLTAMSGEEAANLYIESERIDLLITDIAMPGTMQGFDLAEHIRRITPDLPVIFLSGYAPESEKDSWLGENDVRLTKPVTRTQLHVVVHEALSRKMKMKMKTKVEETSIA